MNRFYDLVTEVEKLVTTQLPTALPDQIQIEVQEVVRQFYMLSCCWRAKLGPYSRTKGSEHVFLNPPIGTALNQVHDAALGGCSLDPVRSGFGRYWVWGADRPDLLTIYPVSSADEDGTVLVDVSLLPKDLETTVPETAVSHHLGTIVAGCLARVYGQPSKPWYNMAEARQQRLEWQKGLAAARTMGVRGYTPTPLRAFNPAGSFA